MQRKPQGSEVRAVLIPPSLSSTETQPSNEPTQQHDHVDQVHPVHGQRLQGAEEGEAADGGPVQVLVVQVTEAPLLGDVDGHQHP